MLARNLNTAFLSCFETQDHHSKGREGNTVWQTSQLTTTTYRAKHSSSVSRGSLHILQRERVSQFLKIRAKASKVPQNYLNKEHQKAIFVNVKLI